MILLVKLIGVLLIVAAIIFELRPKTMRQCFDYCVEGNFVYYIAVARLVLGVFFLIAASQCKFAWVVIIMGILFLLSGIAVFLIGLERSKKIVSTINAKSDLVHRLIAVVPLIIGALIVYAA